MNYIVHRVEVNKNNMQEKLQQFLNNLEGVVVAVIPNVTQYFLCYGAKIDYVLIIEKK